MFTWISDLLPWMYDTAAVFLLNRSKLTGHLTSPVRMRKLIPGSDGRLIISISPATVFGIE